MPRTRVHGPPLLVDVLPAEPKGLASPQARQGDRSNKVRVSGLQLSFPGGVSEGLPRAHREDEITQAITARKASEAIRKARKERRPVWVVVG